MNTTTMPMPAKPAHYVRHYGRAVVEAPTPETVERALRWQHEQFLAQREGIIRASRRVRHHAVQVAAVAKDEKQALLDHIAAEIVRHLRGFFGRGQLVERPLEIGALGHPVKEAA